MSNYPDDIRNYDHDPRSPFYAPPCCSECGEELEEDGNCLVCNPEEEDCER